MSDSELLAMHIRHDEVVQQRIFEELQGIRAELTTVRLEVAGLKGRAAAWGAMSGTLLASLVSLIGSLI